NRKERTRTGRKEQMRTGRKGRMQTDGRWCWWSLGGSLLGEAEQHFTGVVDDQGVGIIAQGLDVQALRIDVGDVVLLAHLGRYGRGEGAAHTLLLLAGP